MTSHFPLRLVVSMTVAFCLVRSAFAGSATWNPGPGAGVWNAPTSWTPSTVPNGPNDTATFAKGNTTDNTVALVADTEVNAIAFQPTPTTFGIKPNAGVVLTLSGAGIVNDSAWQNVVLPSSDSASLPGALIRFTNGAAAGKNIYYVTDNALRHVGGSRISFLDHSSAGSADIRIDGAHDSVSANCQVDFHGDSSADHATFYVNSGYDTGAPGGVVEFKDNATAGHALFWVNGSQNVIPGGGGNVRFNGGTAGDAEFRVSAGIPEGGYVMFSPSSSAGNATLFAVPVGTAGAPAWIALSGDGGTSKIVVGTGCYLDVSGHTSALPLTIGSLSGDGSVFLGNVNLGVGSANLSTVFDGLMQDGNPNGGAVSGGSLTKVGIGTLTLSGPNLYTGGTTVEAGRLLVNNATGSGTGAGPVMVKSARAILGGTGLIDGPVTVNSGAVLSGGNADNAIGSLTIRSDLTLKTGSVVELGLSSGGAHSTLRRSGGTWTFAANQTFTFISGGAQPGVYENIITGLAGDPGDTASWTITNSELFGSFSYDGAGNIDLIISSTASPTPSPASTPTPSPTGTPTPTPNPTAPPGLVGNVSTRLPVGTGDDVLIAGFIVQGAQGSSKKIMVRTIGPSLTGFGIADALANPTLEIHDSSGATVATNDDWKQTEPGGLIAGDQSGEISNSGLAPSSDLESAIIANLAPGSYTAVVRGVNNTTGTGVVDAYDLSGPTAARLANIATRGLVQPGNKLMIAGFIIQNGPVKAVIRATGPSLVAFGINNALPDTTLQLRDQNGAIVRENDNWMTDQKQELEATGLQPTDDLEAALVETLQPGQYTAQVRGKPETTGIGVVQVYFLQ